MCGLYSFRKSAEETRSLLQYLEELEFPPRSYVKPKSPIAIVRLEGNQRHFTLVRCGFIPKGNQAGLDEAVQFLKPAPDDYFVFEPTVVIARNSPPPKPKAQLDLL